MSRRIGYDVTPELVGSTGVARYARELGRALDRRGDCELVRFAVGRRSARAGGRVRHLPVPLRVVHPMWRHLGWPSVERLAGSIDLVHSLDLIAPPTRHPLVMTVHDLAAIEHPELHPERTVRLQRARLAQVHRAAAVIAVSRSTAGALADAGVARERIHVAPLGLTTLPPPGPVSLPDAEEIVLAVGTLEPRKAHDVLISAFARAELTATRLVFAGPTAGRSAELRELAGRLGVGDRLTLLGAVDDATLAGLYRRASVLCMPSVQEGFGLPVLEAMSQGVPVIASDIPTVREVAADAAVRVAPGDAQALADALRRVLDDPTLRARLAARGRTLAAAFTWDATAKATMRAYEHALDAS